MKKHSKDITVTEVNSIIRNGYRVWHKGLIGTILKVGFDDKRNCIVYAFAPKNKTHLGAWIQDFEYKEVI